MNKKEEWQSSELFQNLNIHWLRMMN